MFMLIAKLFQVSGTGKTWGISWAFLVPVSSVGGGEGEEGSRLSGVQWPDLRTDPAVGGETAAPLAQL